MVVQTVSRYIERSDETFDDNDNSNDERVDITRSVNRSAVRLGSDVGHPLCCKSRGPFTIGFHISKQLFHCLTDFVTERFIQCS
jgi:hypothetical protein